MMMHFRISVRLSVLPIRSATPSTPQQLPVYFYLIKPGLYMVGRIVSMCLRPCPEEHITALQVSIAKISCERLLLSKACVTI